MPIPHETRQWVLNSKPLDLPVLDGPNPTFKLTTALLPQSLSKSQVLVKTLYLSNDPAQRCWISPTADPRRLYLPPIAEGESMGSNAVAEVIESGASDRLAPGTLVLAKTNWREYSIHEIDDCQILNPLPGLGVTHFMGSFGLPGLTAYYALTEVVKAKSGETIVVSGAAGATGSMVVQIAKKLIGLKVIGIAGSEEKCRWVEKLGADICINYRKPSFEEDLFRETDDFVDIYYDNVGGRILDLMLLRLKRYGRVAACGTISNYNKDADPVGLKNFYEVVSNRIAILGFIVFDYIHKAAEVRNLLIQAWKDGKIVVDDATETVVEASFEDIPRVWMKLFDGSNTGKLTTKLV
ncbi:NAD(P)-binding protein [Aspergillus ambiguus]|uniref:MDR family NADP-dependent oxidoreductase n=1 Tax=Aspergillus ambiguus TaxID=176160 RepID=UPI003CCCA520